MLPKENRLTRKADFERVYRRGRRLRINDLLVSFLPTKNEASRLGFIVSKKISKKATRRNYIKRVLRTAFRGLPAEVNLSYDVIISVLRDQQEGGLMKIFTENRKEIARKLRQ